MNQTILFDTLKYAKLLTDDGIEYANTHAVALSQALSENLYSKNETDKMIDAALKRFDERTIEIREEMRQNREELREEIRQNREELREEIRQNREEWREESLRIEQRFNQQSHEIKEVRNDLLLKINDVQDNILKKVYFALSLFLAGIALLSAFTHLFH